MKSVKLYGEWAKGALEKGLKGARQIPSLATLELTYRCNLRCKTCGVWEKTDDPLMKKENELSLAQICRLLDDLKNMGVERMHLIGAEPLMRKDLPNILAEINERGIACEITTNGTLVNGDIAHAVVAYGVSRINISVDSVGENHDEIRGVKGTFDRVQKGISLLKEARDKVHKRHPRLTVHTCVSRLNYDQIERIFPFAMQSGADLLRFAYLTETPEEEVKKTIMDGLPIGTVRFIPENGSLLIRKDESHSLRKKLAAIKSASRKSALQVRIGVNLRRGEKGLLEGTVDTARCRTLWNRIIINPVGDVYPCALLDRYAYGNIKKESIQNIWHGGKRSRLLSEIKRSLLPLCRYCGCHYANNLGVMHFVSVLMRRRGG